MTEINPAATPRAVIEEYVAACKVGDVNRLKAIFHDHALMSGYMMGSYLMGPPAPFFDAVENLPEEKRQNLGAYHAEISSVEVSGPVASVTLKEVGFMEMNFTDFFHLAHIDGKWLIISKTFNPDP